MNWADEHMVAEATVLLNKMRLRKVHPEHPLWTYLLKKVFDRTIWYRSVKQPILAVHYTTTQYYSYIVWPK